MATFSLTTTWCWVSGVVQMTVAGMTTTAASEGEVSLQDFSSFELDARLTRVLFKQNILKPTLVQEKAIPLALSGKDLLVKARTGSGKTLAYLLPIMQRLLTVTRSSGSVRTLLLVPTKELAKQVAETASEFLRYCPKEVSCMNLAGEESLQLQRSMLSGHPMILISTPSRLLPHLESKALCLKALEFLVIDEADLVLSFGYSQDLERCIREYISKTVQTFLMSATLTTEMEQLKQLVLRNPVTLKLEEADDEETKLQQYIIRCEQEDKFILMYVALKMKLLKGKLLIFANDVDRCFKLKMFLEQFGIKTCLLNPELPLSSRHHIVDEFNRGVYDIIVASDIGGMGRKVIGKRMKGVKADKEAGVARGVDFKRVDVVINFDLPQRVDSYVHRVGRTARGGDIGTAISFISSGEDEGMLKAIIADQEVRGNLIVPHAFDLKQLDGFRYRCGDALRAVTKAAVKSARLQAVKDEIVKSEKLKTFFEERPKELGLLRHDKNTGAVKSRPHLKHVPGYLLATEAEEHGKRAKLEPLPQMERDPQSKPHRRQKSFHNRKSRDPLKAIKRK
jgi:ATP-dependent RNA helicase DDX56/DBP9